MYGENEMITLLTAFMLSVFDAHWGWWVAFSVYLIANLMHLYVRNN